MLLVCLLQGVGKLYQMNSCSSLYYQRSMHVILEGDLLLLLLFYCPLTLEGRVSENQPVSGVTTICLMSPSAAHLCTQFIVMLIVACGMLITPL